MPLRKGLLEILACPKCKGDVRYDKKEDMLECGKCRLRYRVIDGDIPDMLIGDAEKL